MARSRGGVAVLQQQNDHSQFNGYDKNAERVGEWWLRAWEAGVAKGEGGEGEIYHFRRSDDAMMQVMQVGGGKRKAWDSGSGKRQDSAVVVEVQSEKLR